MAVSKITSRKRSGNSSRAFLSRSSNCREAAISSTDGSGGRSSGRAQSVSRSWRRRDERERSSAKQS